MASEMIDQMREGSAAIKSNGNRLSYTSEWNFLIVTDSVNVQREEVLLNTPGMPVVGLVYGDIGAKCISKTAKRRTDHALYWDVTCEFDSTVEDQKVDPNNPGPNGDPNPDPTTWISVWNVDGFETIDKPCVQDKTPTTASPAGPYKNLNTAKMPFADPLIDKRTVCSFPFVQFEDPSLKLKDIMDRNESVNKTAFTTQSGVYPERTLKLTITKADLGFFANIPCWQIEYRCSYDPDNWDQKRWSMGSVQLNGMPCVVAERGIQIVAGLDINGAQVAFGTVPYTQTFRMLNEIEFANFIRTGL